MTLPFRRRHHDDDSSHDRARALVSTSLVEPLGDPDRAWLERHLERCPECRAERDGFLADRVLLRGLRDALPPPPRDLWARTSAAIEREAGSRRTRRAPLGASLGIGRPRGLPLGPLAGVLVAAVVLAVALLPRTAPFVPPAPTGGVVALASPPPGPTAIPVPGADQVAWVQSNSDGKFSVVIARVGEVCPTGDQGCATLAGGSPVPLDITAEPQAVVRSPTSDDLAVVGSAGDSSDSVLIVSVGGPSASSRPSSAPIFSSAPGSVPPSLLAPTLLPPSNLPASLQPASQPAESAAGSPTASPSAAPASAGHAIIHDVVVVGEPAYSDDGQWFAFSARPLDGSAGPDLYVWHVGDDQATRLTTDGETFFAGWFGNQIVASGIIASASSDGTSPLPADPGASTPASAPSAPSASSRASGSSSPEPSASAGVAIESHPYSFLLDPATRTRTDFAVPDVWLPSIDRTGRFVAYWSGTVTPDVAAAGQPASPGRSWRPATGRLVLDGWSAPLAPAESSPAASAPPSNSAPATTGPTTHPPHPSVAPHGPRESGAAASGAPTGVPGSSPPTASPAVAAGPAGTPQLLVDGPLGDFEARFDPTGTRLAVWTATSSDTTLGPLWLVLLDPVAGRPEESPQPLPQGEIVALRGFSIEEGRLGWVTPPGQNAQPSSVQVLAWQGDDFGKVQTVPGGNPQIVR